MIVDRRTWARLVGLAAALSLLATMLLATVAPALASAAGNGTTVVRGTQLAAGTCADGGYRMTGSLDGCWWIDTFESKSDPSKSNFVMRGHRALHRLPGLDLRDVPHDVHLHREDRRPVADRRGDPWTLPPPRRQHQGGTGGFAGASGEISFHDVVDVTPPYYPYWGNVHLATS